MYLSIINEMTGFGISRGFNKYNCDGLFYRDLQTNYALDGLSDAPLRVLVHRRFKRKKERCRISFFSNDDVPDPQDKMPKSCFHRFLKHEIEKFLNWDWKFKPSVVSIQKLWLISAITLETKTLFPDGDMSTCGFQGSSTINIDLDPAISHFRCGHLAMTYTGLCILLAMGDDLSGVNRNAIIAGILYNCPYHVW